MGSYETKMARPCACVGQGGTVGCRGGWDELTLSVLVASRRLAPNGPCVPNVPVDTTIATLPHEDLQCNDRVSDTLLSVSITFVFVLFHVEAKTDQGPSGRASAPSPSPSHMPPPPACLLAARSSTSSHSVPGHPLAPPSSRVRFAALAPAPCPGIQANAFTRHDMCFRCFCRWRCYSRLRRLGMAASGTVMVGKG